MSSSSSSCSLPWKKVDTAVLPEPSSNRADQNHYDDQAPSSNGANRDLEAAPGEGVAMFVGLEVLQGDQYTVQDGKLTFVIKAVSNDGSEKVEKKNNDKKRKAATTTDEDVPPSTEDKQVDSKVTKKSKKKKQKKQKKRQKTLSEEEEIATPQDSEASITATTTFSVDNNDVERLQTSWMMATGGVQLHSQLCVSLLAQEFWTPTPIQAATLAPAILGRRNIVGAAPTGSGKTLAYLLPILQSLLTTTSSTTTTSSVLQAIILTPTRELALQVSRECDILLGNTLQHKCVVIVGGLAMAKQARMLQQHEPPIVVATPGRLWELVRMCICCNVRKSRMIYIAYI